MQITAVEIEHADAFVGGLHVCEVEYGPPARITEIADGLVLCAVGFHVEHAGIEAALFIAHDLALCELVFAAADIDGVAGCHFFLCAFQ